TLYDISYEEAAEYFTDGGNDAGVDGIHIDEVIDGEFVVTFFQGKYKINLEGNSPFPETEVEKAIATVSYLLDPQKPDDFLNDRLRPKIEEIRSLISDGYIPYVHFYLCNNGKKWTKIAQNKIEQSGFGDKIEWQYINHDTLFSIKQNKKEVNDKFRLHGTAIIDDQFAFRRVLIGKISTTEIQDLLNKHGDLLLERNIRRYLGGTNRVNRAIAQTLRNKKQKDNFYFFNNGITMICNKFRHNVFQGSDYVVSVEGMKIVNGGQTCKIIQETLNDPKNRTDFSNVFVLLRLYELTKNEQSFVDDITYATNNQNLIELQDLHSNDKIQRQLEVGMSELKKFSYKRFRGGNPIAGSISPIEAAVAVLSVWRQSPHQARFMYGKLFGVLYNTIFKNLNSAQLVLAVLIFRKVEYVKNYLERKTTVSFRRIEKYFRTEKDVSESKREFTPYSSCFYAMIIGSQLLHENKIPLQKINHQNFHDLEKYLEENFGTMYLKSVQILERAIVSLYGSDKDIPLQRLSATFRRGDLLETLKPNLNT
ncbi:MAG: AIPR family protein, partial [Planctomycetaceae bacterium]|nr:AIPR family protein [Planctomycetaceae bacterium]